MVIQQYFPGVNINYIPTCGKTALSTAAALGDVPILRLLLDVDKTCSKSCEEDYYWRTKSVEPKWTDRSDDRENKNNSSPRNNRTCERKHNLGYYIVVRGDEFDLGLDAETPEDMDNLEWDVEMSEGEGEGECDDVWSSQYRWYADILDKTGGLIENTPCGCDVNLQDYTGRSAVHYAVEYSQVEALKCLVSAGMGCMSNAQFCRVCRSITAGK